MQPIKQSKISFSKSLLAGAILAAVSGQASALVTDFKVGFSTVPNITLTQTTPINFGTGLGLASNATCSMDVGIIAAGGYPGNVAMGLSDGTIGAEGLSYANLTGVGCEASLGLDGTPGVYTISGVAGGTVNVSVTELTTGTHFNYDAVGCVATYNGAGNGDTCDAVVTGTPTAAVLASDGDTVSNTGTPGTPAPGFTKLVLGGTIVAQQAHTAGDPLTESFVITVTY